MRESLCGFGSGLPFEPVRFDLRVAPGECVTAGKRWYECVKTVKDPLFFAYYTRIGQPRRHKRQSSSVGGRFYDARVMVFCR